MVEKDITYQRKKELAFSKGTSTAFLVGSPLQVLCAEEAIKEFEIKDYLIVFLADSLVRDQQILDMLNAADLRYEIRYTKDFSVNENLQYIPQDDTSDHQKFDRVMVGEYRFFHVLSLCGQYASSDSVLVYFDDGVDTISVLNGHDMIKSPLKLFIKKLLGKRYVDEIIRQQISEHWKKIGLYDGGFFYTLYSDIKSNKYLTYGNNFSHLLYSPGSSSPLVLVIGTKADDYDWTWGIYINEFEHILYKSLCDVKREFPNEQIVYIPHGRDMNPKIKEMCEDIGIEYRRLSTSIEQYVITNNVVIKAAYGFNSSALYTLLLLTGANATSWNIYNRFTPSFRIAEEIADYYRKHGIRVLNIHTGVNFIRRIYRYIKHKH